ncbi:hypothetical protein SLS60_006988 [Paraconiothyrium brasiliense]|uniref:Enoyl reductase (ER) domain-containing protein n=1 Tax=Paraconiothyrium brasiliense TaxID=300254 RepID=A0ABR3R8B1_9PLEO
MGSISLPKTMKALVTPSQGAPAEVRDNVPLPEPSPTQVLVKTLYAAINPVDVFTTQFGLLVDSWPFIPGCEASGIVAKAGAEARNPLGGYFKEGDIVAGCARPGAKGHGTFAEYFLLDAEVTVPKPGSLTAAQASSVELVKSLGADATIDYKRSAEDVVEEVKRVTREEVDLAFDAVSVNNDLVTKIFTAIPSSTGRRLYTTTNDWDPAPDASLGFTTKPIELGPIGRPSAAELNSKLTSWIPVVYRLLESGKLKAGGYSVEGEGIDGVPKAWQAQKSGKLGNKKVIAKVADE